RVRRDALPGREPGDCARLVPRCRPARRDRRSALRRMGTGLRPEPGLELLRVRRPGGARCAGDRRRTSRRPRAPAGTGSRYCAPNDPGLKGTTMRIAIVGGGPGGLFLATLVKASDPAAEVTVFERNRADDTFGFGVVFSDATLAGIHAADPVVRDALAEYGV